MQAMMKSKDKTFIIAEAGINHIGDLGLAKEMISAGIAYAYEIEDAVRAIRETGNDHITFLHCASSYPTDPSEVYLKKITGSG